MNDNPLVSIVCPTHNCEKFISSTLESIFSQTYQNFEIIIVDDCSSDSTINVIKQFKDNRIKLFINDKNSGAAFSRNLAIKESQGDYIAFLDGDDVWESTKLEEQLAFMIQNKYNFSYTFYNVINENGGSIGKVVKGPRKITRRKFKQICYCGCLTVMYKRNAYPDLQIPNNIFKRNDYALWLKLSEKETCFCLNKILAHYRKHDGTISSGKKSKLYPFHVELYKKLYGYNSFRANYCALKNVIFYIFKNVFYVKKEK